MGRWFNVILIIAAVAIAVIMAIQAGLIEPPTGRTTIRDLSGSSLGYVHDVEAGKCFAILVRGDNGVAIAQCDCQDVPGGLLIEVKREK